MLFVAALGIDLWLGELPAPIHPVVWFGKSIDALVKRAPRTPAGELAYGAIIPLLVGGGAWLATAGICRGTRRLGWVGFALEAGLLSSSFAVQGLANAALTVAGELANGQREAARAALPALVSRDTADLTESQMTAAAIESVAENFGDSVVGPWMWYAVGGLPAAMAYRALNTVDSMIGYHGRFEWLGKAGARIDDLASWAPARLAALLIALAGPGRAAAIRTVIRDHAATASPNAGWPMASMAGGLDRRLDKVGHYVLNAAEPAPAPPDILRAIHCFRRATALAVAATLLALFAQAPPAESSRAGRR